MINLLLSLILLTCFGVAAAWVAEHPGSVTIFWFDYRIDTSLAFLAIAAASASLLIAFTVLVVRHLVLAPGRYSDRKKLRYYRKGMRELTYSVAALAAADVKGAELHTKKAGKLLGQTPLVLLLSAQIARSRGDDSATRQLLEQMLTHQETEYLAARSLSDAASKQHQLIKALALAERAQAINPGDIAQIISLQIRLGKWQEAQLTLNKAVRKGRLSRNEWRHYRGVVYLQQGLLLMEAGQAESGLAAARYGLKEMPDFAPAIMLAARAFAANGQQKKAMKLLFTAIQHAPHPQMVDALRDIIMKVPPQKQAKLLAKLNAFKSGATTSESWACSSCGTAAKQWAAHCPACNAFDTLEWKKRELKFVA